jgi:hypothetical protein
MLLIPNLMEIDSSKLNQERHRHASTVKVKVSRYTPWRHMRGEEV